MTDIIGGTPSAYTKIDSIWATTLVHSLKHTCRHRVATHLCSTPKTFEYPQSHFVMQIDGSPEPIMQVYFVSFTIEMFKGLPETKHRNECISFFQDNSEQIHRFIKIAAAELRDYSFFAPIFEDEQMKDYILMIHERSKAITQILRDQNIETDLFLNMSIILHSLYELYTAALQKSK